MKFFLSILCCFVFSIYLSSPQQAWGIGFYPNKSTGYDISYPQCDAPYPEKPYAFGIIGVNGGKSFTKNPCLFDEFYWAKSGQVPPSLYINLNYPSGKTAQIGMVGPAGNCAKSNTSCQAYNYGYAAAEYAYLSARSQVIDSSMWWIDIELANTWSDTVSLNASVLSGALMYLHAHGITVGIYSVESNWTAIMGDTFTSMDTTLTDIPNWVVAYDEDVPVSSFCSQPFIVGSQVWLVQYTQEIFDGDYACDTN